MYLLNLLLQIIPNEEELRFLGIKLINSEDYIELVTRFALNLSVIIIIVVGLYAKTSKRKDFYFTYIAISIVIFLLCFLLESVKIELGFALGLFAIFGIIRYRTDAIPIKEMTYLFVVIAVSVINALANKKISYAELITTNLLVVVGLYILEKILNLKQEISYRVIYEKIENVQAGKEEILLADLKERTGIDIKHFEIERIDFLRDVAYIYIFFDIYSKNKTDAK
ncbi:MAG: DUF4956 domain-containing protein [Bacteroidota bacterium]|nr:DUF4956 domain-containing protein [Odoribacter sp.]MDP3642505.1 DUF4956 domain-containing protein [Bacteroidota bacterium]